MIQSSRMTRYIDGRRGPALAHIGHDMPLRSPRNPLHLIGRMNVTPSSGVEFLVEDKLAALGATSPCDRRDWRERQPALMGDDGRQAQPTEVTVP